METQPLALTCLPWSGRLWQRRGPSGGGSPGGPFLVLLSQRSLMPQRSRGLFFASRPRSTEGGNTHLRLMYSAAFWVTLSHRTWTINLHKPSGLASEKKEEYDDADYSM